MHTYTCICLMYYMCTYMYRCMYTYICRVPTFCWLLLCSQKAYIQVIPSSQIRSFFAPRQLGDMCRAANNWSPLQPPPTTGALAGRTCLPNIAP